ncbi:hypothetical protein DP42_5836 [Burkholderia pseudomallei]|nr:hypothetical protein DO73_5141 [Burkholderia pseudomallei]KGD29427.1 hypothetical protein DP42_5836 [Burkholderia pseudomallei]
MTSNFHARRHDEDDLRAIDGMGMGVSDAMRCDAVRCCVERYTTATTAAPIGQAVAQPAPRTDAPLAASPTLAAPVPGGGVDDVALNGRVSRRALARRRAKSERAARHARCVRRRAVVLHAAARMKARAAAVFHCTSMRRGRASSRLGIVSFNTPS